MKRTSICTTILISAFVLFIEISFNAISARAGERCVVSTSPAKPKAVAMVELILKSTGLPNNIEVLEGQFARNCIAVAGFDGKRRMVIYDGAQFHWQKNSARWDEIGIIAHEIGHILDYHWLVSGSTPPNELIADFFAGFSVEKIGGNLSNALSWTPRVSEYASRTHPSRSDRIQAVSLGWGSARLQRMLQNGIDTGSWIGTTFIINNTICRMAFPEKISTLRPRIACRKREKYWEWLH